MATYDNLPVYKKTYDLMLQIYALCDNMERDYKFTYGERLKNEMLDMVMNIFRANCRREKSALLENARENIEVVRMLLRLGSDMKKIPVNGHFVSANYNISEISKQLTLWLKSQNREKKKQVSIDSGESQGRLFAFPESAN